MLGHNPKRDSADDESMAPTEPRPKRRYGERWQHALVYQAGPGRPALPVWRVRMPSRASAPGSAFLLAGSTAIHGQVGLGLGSMKALDDGRGEGTRIVAPVVSRSQFHADTEARTAGQRRFARQCRLSKGPVPAGGTSRRDFNCQPATSRASAAASVVSRSRVAIDR